MEYAVLFLGICATVVSSQMFGFPMLNSMSTGGQMFGFSMPSPVPRRCQKQPDWNCELGSQNYYYNTRSQKCEWSMFQCGSANRNSFLNEKACVKACGCHASPDPGECPADKNVTMTQRYYFNGMFEMCLSFNYSGCGGNNNNFKSFFQCLHTCGGSGGGEMGLFDIF